MQVLQTLVCIIAFTRCLFDLCFKLNRQGERIIRLREHPVLEFMGVQSKQVYYWR